MHVARRLPQGVDDLPQEDSVSRDCGGPGSRLLLARSSEQSEAITGPVSIRIVPFAAFASIERHQHQGVCMER